MLAQSVQFVKIAKNSNTDFCQFLSHWKKHCSYQNHEIKNGGHSARFCSRAAESAHRLHFQQFLRGLGRVSKWNLCGRRKKTLKHLFFFNRIYTDISQLGGNVIEMALKWNLKWFNTALTSTMRVSVRKMNSATRVPLTLRTFPTHWVYLGQKQPQLRSPITFSSWFLFHELHFMNNVSSDPFFTGAILLYPVRDAQCNTNPGYARGGGAWL